MQHTHTDTDDPALDERADQLTAEVERLVSTTVTRELSARAPAARLGLPAGASQGRTPLGLDAADVDRFSWARAMTACKIGLESRSLPAALGYEAEVMREATKKYEGTEVYADLVQRLASNTTGSSGAFLVSSEVSERFVEKILARTIVGKLGAARLTVTSGQLLVNAEDSLVTTNFLDTEDDVGAITESTPTWKEMQMRPRWIGSLARASWEMQKFSEPGIEERIANQMQRQIAVKVDERVFLGTGSGSELRGLLQSPAVSTRVIDYDTVKYGRTTPETFTDKTRALAQLLMDDNFDIEDIRFAAEPTILKAISTVRDSQNRPLHLPTDTPAARRLIGLPIEYSSHLKDAAATNLRLIAGVWSLGLLVADWGNVAIAVSDSHSGAFAKGQRWLRAIMGIDCAVIRPTAFSSAVNLAASEITND